MLIVAITPQRHILFPINSSLSTCSFKRYLCIHERRLITSNLSRTNKFNTRYLASLKNLFQQSLKKDKFLTASKPVLAANNLFHPLSQSPIPELRSRARIISIYGVCPTCEKMGRKGCGEAEEETQLKVPPGQVPRLQPGKNPLYDCPNCGYPTHCSKEHYDLDQDHAKYCEGLRESNEDEHELRAGRQMKEFEFPTAQDHEHQVNMQNWDLFFYTRGFHSIDRERSVRHISKLLTYPITIASVLHESGPYTLWNRLTVEGLKSLTALRTTIYQTQKTRNIQNLAPTEMIRVIIIGARAEAQLPLNIYQQICYLFPSTIFHIFFVGPEVLAPNQTSPSTKHFSPYLSFTWTDALYHDYHENLEPFDPYTDIFFLFSPGFGQENGRESWGKSVKKLLRTKCAIIITGYDEEDMQRDVEALKVGGWVKLDDDPESDDSTKKHIPEFDWLLTPGKNVFYSKKRDVWLEDVRKSIYANWGIFGIRGKKYEVKSFEDIHTEEEDEWSDEEEEIKQLPRDKS